MNGFIKDGAHQAVDDPERRRIRGRAAQSVLLAFQLFGASFRKIADFRKALIELASKLGKKIRSLPPRRRTKSLTTWLPETSRFTVAETADDPDPPLTA
ncbi:MAG TPA: hypothetical protein VN648_20405 [Candidatus Methylomirabilis sp.]|nr:hypothetical protein [Candidatus Methylomirabilis sp.]